MNVTKKGYTDQLYRIGTVASLTGLSVERLRAWERRYDLCPAHKSGKTRFYDKSQLDRFKLIKRLIDLGHPISTLVDLDEDQLLARIEHQTQEAEIYERPSINQTNPKIGLIGPNLLLLEQNAFAKLKSKKALAINIVARWANIDSFEAERHIDEDIDIIVAQLPVLNETPINQIQECFPKSEIIVLYQFTTSQTISQIQQKNIPTIKWPVSWAEIEYFCLNGRRILKGKSHPSPRKFSDEELIAIASSSEDPTGCPEYLVESIHQLNALATYSSECAEGQGSEPAYLRLHTNTTHARAELEIALEDLILVENSEKSAKKVKKH